MGLRKVLKLIFWHFSAQGQPTHQDFNERRYPSCNLILHI
jgi:hypothetical protein